MQTSPEGLEALRQRGIQAVPVVMRGDEYVTGFDLAGVDALLGLAAEGPEARAQLSGAELLARTARAVTTVAALAEQVPAEHLDDPLPGQADNAAVLYRRDGSPYIPHRTTRGLIAHVVGHAEKVRCIIELCAAGPEHVVQPEFAAHPAEFGAFGEPEEGTDLRALVDALRALAEQLGQAASGADALDLSPVLNFASYDMPIRQFLEVMTVSTMVHTLQLEAILAGLGIEPAATLAAGDRAGLELPDKLFD